MMTMKRSPNPQSGITLMETLLVVGLLSGILLVLTVMLQDFVRREHMRGVAGQMAMAQRAVSEMVKSASSFSELYRLASDNGGVAEVSILAPVNPARALSGAYAVTSGVSLEAGGMGLRPSTVVNAGYEVGGNNHSGFRDTIPLRASSYLEEYANANNGRREARLTLLVRAVDAGGERGLELLLVTVDRVPERELREAAALMDAHGGIISGRDTGTNDCHTLGCGFTARGALGNWIIPLPDFAGTRWHDSVLASNPARFEDEGGEGYLASYHYVSEAVIAGDYLYRVAVPGNPDLNRMYTRLDLGNNDVLGADNVEIRNDTETALRVNNAVHAQGSAYVGGNLLVGGDLDVNGTMRAGDMRVTPQNPVSPAAARSVGNIVVGDRFKTGDMNAGGSVSVIGEAHLTGASAGNAAANLMTTGTLSAGGATVLTGALANADTITASGAVQAGQIYTPTLQAQSVGVVQGEMASGNLSVGNGLNAASGKMQIQGGASINNLISCERGC